MIYNIVYNIACSCWSRNGSPNRSKMHPKFILSPRGSILEPAVRFAIILVRSRVPFWELLVHFGCHFGLLLIRFGTLLDPFWGSYQAGRIILHVCTIPRRFRRKFHLHAPFRWNFSRNSARVVLHISVENPILHLCKDSRSNVVYKIRWMFMSNFCIYKQTFRTL